MSQSQSHFTMGTENVFQNQGIQFKIVTPDMFPAVNVFMWGHLFPDEPISRSIGMTRNSFMEKYYLKEAMNDGTSMVALDKEGKIIGARLGMRKRRSDWVSYLFDKLPWGSLTWLMPNEMRGLPVMVKFLKVLGYDVWKMFDQLGCDLIYEGRAVCSARTSGVRGLGTELVIRVNRLVKELGCTHTYICATGTNNVLLIRTYRECF